MKHLFFSVLILGFLQSNAQKVTIEEVNEPFSSGHVNSYKLVIPYATQGDVAKAWKSWLKGKDAKLAENKGVIFADNTVLKEFGSNTCDIYTKVCEWKNEGTIMYVAFDLGDNYLKCESSPDKCAIAKGQLNSFGFLQAKEALEEMTRTEDKKLAKLKDKQNDLEKDNKDLHQDIERLKGKIAKAENELTFTEQSLEKKKEEVAIQKRVVDAASGAVDEQAEKAKKIYKNLMDDQNDLEKKQRNLKNDIVDYKETISKKERKISDNETEQKQKQREIADQEGVVSRTKDKMKTLTE